MFYYRKMERLRIAETGYAFCRIALDDYGQTRKDDGDTPVSAGAINSLVALKNRLCSNYSAMNNGFSLLCNDDLCLKAALTIFCLIGTLNGCFCN